jgi:cytochrome P450
VLVAGDPELAKQVFQAPADVLHAGEGNRRVLGRLFGDHSLILLDGERHMGHRRLLLPAFHGRRLRRQAAAMRARAEACFDAWPSGEVASLPRMRELTLDVVIGAVFGDGDGDARPLREALLALVAAAGAGGGEASPPARVAARAERLIEQQVDARDDGPGEDVLSLLLAARHEDGSSLSREEIRDELLTLVVAGTETTAAALAWALELLARSPRAQARAAAEATGDGEAPYIDAVAHETLRMRPAVPMSARLVKRRFELGGHSLEPGAVVAVSALLIHHREDVYPEPLAFRPERFLGEQPGTYSWIPFGGGVRRCIGAGFALMEMRAVLAALLSRLVPRAAPGPPEGMRSRGNTLAPARGGHVALVPRGAPAARSELAGSQG